MFHVKQENPMPEYKGEPIAHGPTSAEFVARCRVPQVIVDDPVALDLMLRHLPPSHITRTSQDPVIAGLEMAKNYIIEQRSIIRRLEAQLLAEGEHTAAANANIDRLNTEIERVTRHQQGPLMGKD